MDPASVISALRDTLNSDKQAEAVKLLNEIHKIIGFVPTLLKIILEDSLEIAVRQAAALYFKNNVSEWWEDVNPDDPEEANEFNIHEQDRQTIRNALVSAIVASPIPLQSQLKIALSKIVKIDYPSRFTEFPDQIKHFLASSDHRDWYGALVCLLSFVKVHEYPKAQSKNIINAPMRDFFPIMYTFFANIVSDSSEASLNLQYLIIRVFYSYINFHFPLDVLHKEAIGQWVAVFCAIMQDQVSISDPTHIHWKRKKWTMRVVHRLFTRYGCPGVVLKKFKSFAEWYMHAFSSSVITVLLNVCEAYRQGTLISKPVLAITLEYFTAALSQSFAWKSIRPHFPLLVREVIFPLLSHSDEDEELWQSDPIEYIRYEASDWGGSDDPTSAAFILLGDACLKRRDVLNNVIPFCIHILTTNSQPNEKDAVLHMYGAIAEILLKKEMYRNQLEPFLSNHVIPTLHAPEGYRRGRACWLIGKLSEASFNDDAVFARVVDEVRKTISDDPEIPVRTFAALCLADLIRAQKKSHQHIIPHLRDLLMQLMKLLRETEFDDLSQVIERLIVTFEKEITPIAVELLINLCETFMKLVRANENGFSDSATAADDTEDDTDYLSVVATSVLDNIESLLQIGEEQEDLMAQMEPIVAKQIQIIFEREMTIFYEEALTLLFSLTAHKISPLMWDVFDRLYTVFQKDSADSFSEMMPCLHNFVRIDSTAFLSDPKRIEMVASMCSEVLQSDDQSENVQMHAAKLLEVLLLNCQSQIDNYAPKFIELALMRLTKPISSKDLRAACIQVVVAGMLYSPSNILHMMAEHHWPGTSLPILDEFLKVWLEDVNEYRGLHDRRLCVLGLCTLLYLPNDQRPAAVATLHKTYLPSLLTLFAGLKRAYAVKARNQNEDDDGSNGEDSNSEAELDSKALNSDEDEVDDEGESYLEMLEDGLSDDDDDDDDDDGEDGDEETALEAFETVIDDSERDMDEYVTFYRIMTELENSDPAWYGQLMNGLSGEQHNDLKSIVVTALDCIRQKESKRIEQSGGYKFATVIPPSFNFGGGDTSTN